jgi:hypothetical protein
MEPNERCEHGTFLEFKTCDQCARDVVLETFTIENARAFIAEQSSGDYWWKEVLAARALLANAEALATEARWCLATLVSEYGPWHEDDCPADDTCECSAKPLHDRINAVLRGA